MKSQFKNGQVRVDFLDPSAEQGPTLVSTNLYLANGDLIQVNHPAHSYIRSSASQMKLMREAIKTMEANAPKAPTIDKVTASGQERVIDGRKARLYVVSMADGQSEMQFWVSDDFNDLNLIRQVIACAGAAFDPLQSGLAEALYEKVPGLAVESVTSFAGAEARGNLKSIERSDIPDTAFAIPQSYREAQAPMSTMGKGPAPRKP